MRLGFVIFAVLLRFALMPIYLQTYLNLAYQRIEEQKKEAGRIKNTEYQKKVIVNFLKLIFHLLTFSFSFFKDHINFLLFVCSYPAVCCAHPHVSLFHPHV
jgi:cytochrome c oxidase assembly protein Cox11